MKVISDLRQKHLAGWTKALRELKPENVGVVTELPEVEFDGVTVKAAIVAGWVEGVDDPTVVDDMKGGEVSKFAAEVWKSFKEARQIDPN